MGRKSREKKQRQDEVVPWTPFVCTDKNVSVVDEAFDIYLNSRYTVLLRKYPNKGESWPDLIHLSIRRNDRKPIHDWRDLQRIKNELVGPENEAVELYPAESRLVDTSNQFHLWVIADPTVRLPFGYGDRLVSETPMPNTKQRPFEKDARPDDLTVISKEMFEKAKKKRGED